MMHKWACAVAALAGMTGAGGIALAAVAAHLVSDPMLQTAAEFLVLHATAMLALSGLALAAPQRGSWFLGAAGLFLCGSLLLGGDLSARALSGARLFPMAAPLGGALLTIGWAFVALAALIMLRSPHRASKPEK